MLAGPRRGGHRVRGDNHIYRDLALRDLVERPTVLPPDAHGMRTPCLGKLVPLRISSLRRPGQQHPAQLPPHAVGVPRGQRNEVLKGLVGDRLGRGPASTAFPGAEDVNADRKSDSSAGWRSDRSARGRALRRRHLLTSGTAPACYRPRAPRIRLSTGISSQDPGVRLMQNAAGFAPSIAAGALVWTRNGADTLEALRVVPCWVRRSAASKKGKMP